MSTMMAKMSAPTSVKRPRTSRTCSRMKRDYGPNEGRGERCVIGCWATSPIQVYEARMTMGMEAEEAEDEDEVSIPQTAHLRGQSSQLARREASTDSRFQGTPGTQ